MCEQDKSGLQSQPIESNRVEKEKIRVMNLAELKLKKIDELVELARGLKVEGYSSLRISNLYLKWCFFTFR